MTQHGPIVPLLHLQGRILWNNRTACAVLILLPLAGMFAGKQRPAVETNTCYVVYWQESAWVERLRAELPRWTGQGIRIVVRHVGQFVDDHGVVCYPRGAHSIQIRPPDETRPHWVIWYWYSGDDPQVLDGPVTWFWNVTNAHFAGEPPVQVRVSHLGTGIPLLPVASISLDYLEGDSAKRFVVWTTLFFCACYLPALSLAHQRESSTILSLMTTPAGWRGPARATWLFHGGLTWGMALLAVFLLDIHGPVIHLLLALALAIVAYLGIAFVIGSWCGSTASAGAGLSLYLVLTGLAIGIGCYLPDHWVARVSQATIEIHILVDAASEHPGPATESLLRLSIWALAAQLVGWQSFRHRCRTC